jgi:hypothetical protein
LFIFIVTRYSVSVPQEEENRLPRSVNRVSLACEAENPLAGLDLIGPPEIILRVSHRQSEREDFILTNILSCSGTPTNS